MTTLFITASDTGVGKTHITANLLKLLLKHGINTRAIKPIETGFNYDTEVPHGSDVHAYSQINPANIYPPAYYFDVPASPHYSARLAGSHVDIDVIEDYCHQHIEQADITLIEGAGGLLVPFNDTSKEDKSYNFTHLIKRLNCPIVLVINNQLGAINQALINIQLCDFYGIDIACVLMNQTDPTCELALENIAFVQSQTDVPVVQVNQGGSFEEFEEELSKVFTDLVRAVPPPQPSPKEGGSSLLSQSLTFDKTHLWHPYTSMTEPLKAYHVNYAEGKHIYISETLPQPLSKGGEFQSSAVDLEEKLGRGDSIRTLKLLDCMSSWWAVNLGYNRAELNRSAIRQMNQFSHVMFGGLTHDPAVELGKTLINIMPNDPNRGEENQLDRIFYSDSGSVSVEVSIKMALQYQQAKSIDPLLSSNGELDPLLTSPSINKKSGGGNPLPLGGVGGETKREGTKKRKILTPLGGYHGDTFGVMSVCDPVNGMHGLFKGMLAEQIFIPRPDCRYDVFSKNTPFDPECLEPLNQAIAKHKDEIAGIIIEPMVQGAGGMWLYHPEYLRHLRKVCDEHDMVLIFDEIATGFGRTGELFASSYAGVVPDIICLGKALTGGFMSFACTVTSRRIAEGISQKDEQGRSNPFMHGPTYMGNPLACAVAKTAIDTLMASNWQQKVQNIEQWLADGLAPCRELPAVADVRVLGAIGVVELHEPVDVQRIQAYFIRQGVWIRPFGKLIYTMPHFNFDKADIERICGAIKSAIEKKQL